MFTLALIVVFAFGGYGCNKKKPTNPSERASILEVQKTFITSILEDDKDSFLKCHADNTLSQTNAIYHYDFFTLYRKLYLSVINQYSQEGWEKYQSFEYVGVSYKSQMCELNLEEVDEFVGGATVTFKGSKATLTTPENISIVYSKSSGNWCIDIKDNPMLEWSGDVAQKCRKAFQAAIEESEKEEATIKSIKAAFNADS